MNASQQNYLFTKINKAKTNTNSEIFIFNPELFFQEFIVLFFPNRARIVFIHITIFTKRREIVYNGKYYESDFY